MAITLGAQGDYSGVTTAIPAAVKTELAAALNNLSSMMRAPGVDDGRANSHTDFDIVSPFAVRLLQTEIAALIAVIEAT